MTTFNLKTATDAVKSGDKEEALKASIWAIGHYEKYMHKLDKETAKKMVLFSPLTLDACVKFAEYQKGFIKDKGSKLTAPQQKFQRNMKFWGFTSEEQISDKFFTYAKELASKDNAPIVQELLKDTTRGYSTLNSLYKTVVGKKSKDNGAKNANSSKQTPADKFAGLIQTAFAYGKKNGMSNETMLEAIIKKYGKTEAEAPAEIEAEAA